MATGREHDNATRVFSVPASIATIVWTGEFWPGASVFLGFVITLFVNPDLDIEGRTGNETWLRKNYGCLGILWQACWYIYALAIPHRGVLSHGALIGTVIRYLYIFWPILLWIGTFEQPRREFFLGCMLWLFVGMAMSDLLHLIMDKI